MGLRGWLDREVIQTEGETPPACLEWTCETCGPQPPVALAGHRWVRRRCRCERVRRAQQAVENKRERQAQVSPPGGGSLTRLGYVLSRREPAGPPPAGLIWECPTCGLIQPFALPSGRWLRRSCACARKAREARKQLEALATWKQEQLARTFGGWLGPQWVDQAWIAAMATKTFASYDPVLQPEAYEAARAFAKTPQGNLLLWGEAYGVGKTHLEAAICNYAREVGWPTAGGSLRPSSSLFVSASQLFAAYHETKRAFDQTAHLRLMSALAGSPLLVIDDIDKRSPREQDWEVYWLIFDARYTASRPTVCSTNRRDDLERYLGKAALSRFSHGLVAVEMDGEDYRRDG